MGFLARLLIGIGIVYWLSPAPVNYRANHEQQQAEAVLAALAGLSTRKDASRDEIEDLAVKAGKALSGLDAQTRKMLIDQYFSPGSKILSLEAIIH